MRIAAVLMLVLLLTGCSSKAYRETDEGKFSGALDVRWVKNDYFLFLPNKDDPFRYTRKDGTTIRPGIMYTDGGSIPRFLWGIKGYSPWGYAPAYIIHDWLFEAQHCGYKPDNKYSFDDSVTVMAETMKALMETHTEFRDYFVFDSVVAAIGTPIAKRLWDSGECKPPAIRTFGITDESLPGDFIMTIRY